MHTVFLATVVILVDRKVKDLKKERKKAKENALLFILTYYGLASIYAASFLFIYFPEKWYCLKLQNTKLIIS